MMNIILTGSLGHIGKPLTEILVAQGHHVTVATSSADRQKDIEALGATAAVGSLEDASFVASTFAGKEAAYCMIPPNNYFDPNLDLLAYYSTVAHNYAAAIEAAGIKRVVHLSSVGAHLDQDSGLILGHHNVEEILKTVPNISLTHLRPTSFYYNLYSFIPVIKSNGMIATNDNPKAVQSWVAPEHIAQVAAAELQKTGTGGNVMYIANDEKTGIEIAQILGNSIDKPDLKWVQLPDEVMLQSLKDAGMNPQIAEGFVEMYAKVRTGEMVADYEAHKPKEFGAKKLADFAKEFAAVYHQPSH